MKPMSIDFDARKQRLTQSYEKTMKRVRALLP